MVELCEGALLDGKALPAGGGQPGIAQDLERNPPADVLALGEIDDPHSAFAEDPFETICRKLLERRQDPMGVEHASGGAGQAAIEGGTRARILVEQGEDVG